MSFLILFGVIAVVWMLRNEAEAEKKRADNLRDEAEKLVEHTLFYLRDELEPIGRLDILKTTQMAVGEYYDKVGYKEDDLDKLRRISVFYNNSGDIFKIEGYLQTAGEQYQKGLEIAKRLANIEPNNTQWQRDLSISYDRLGDFYTATGDLKHAEAEYQKGLEIRKRLATIEPNNTQWQRDLWVSYYKFYTLEKNLNYLQKCVDKIQEMKQKGTLLPTDEVYLESFLGILEEKK